MASIKSILEKKKGVAGNWDVIAWTHEDGTELRTLYHYSTRMLEWSLENPADERYLYMNAGWGSVSDQNGLNTAFRVLNLPWYYSRHSKNTGFIQLTTV